MPRATESQSKTWLSIAGMPTEGSQNNFPSFQNALPLGLRFFFIFFMKYEIFRRMRNFCGTRNFLWDEDLIFWNEGLSLGSGTFSEMRNFPENKEFPWVDEFSVGWEIFPGMIKLSVGWRIFRSMGIFPCDEIFSLHEMIFFRDEEFSSSRGQRFQIAGPVLSAARVKISSKSMKIFYCISHIHIAYTLANIVRQGLDSVAERAI